jgi:hypothetical protein
MRRAFCVAIFALAAAFAAAEPVLAAAQITVGLSQSRRVALRGVASNVVVADPKIADVTMVDTHSVIVIGKALGVTQVMVFDHGGRTLLDAPVLVATSNAGAVTVFRGTGTTDYSCAPHCQSSSSGAEADAAVAGAFLGGLLGGMSAAKGGGAPAAPTPGM